LYFKVLSTLAFKQPTQLVFNRKWYQSNAKLDIHMPFFDNLF